MPLYEYECDACRHRFEKIQKFSDPREDKCPNCGGRVHKLASSPAIQFKGSGFYITDYAKKDHTAAAKADSADGGKSDKVETSGKSEKPDKPEKSESASKTDTSKPSPSASSSKGAGGSGSSSSSSASSPATKSST